MYQKEWYVHTGECQLVLSFTAELSSLKSGKWFPSLRSVEKDVTMTTMLMANPPGSKLSRSMRVKLSDVESMSFMSMKTMLHSSFKSRGFVRCHKAAEVAENSLAAIWAMIIRLLTPSTFSSPPFSLSSQAAGLATLNAMLDFNNHFGSVWWATYRKP